MIDPPFPINNLLALLLTASAIAAVVKWVRIPYAVALVIAGFVIGQTHALPAIYMTPDLVLVIFLPALLFEAAWNLDIKILQRDWLPISVLATFGVIVCMLGTGAILHFGGGMNLQTALLFGAMISATDPVSVVALFRQMGIDTRLTMILEGESLFNDGTAVVLFRLVLAFIIASQHHAAHWTIPSATMIFLVVTLGGLLLGAAIGYIASRITSAFDDHLLEITLTVVTAYGTFLIAEHLCVSPVMAVVAAGVVVGNFGSRTGMSATTRLAVNSFWEYAAFFVNSLLFLLIGLQIKLPILLKNSQLIGFGVLAVMISRMLVIYGLCPLVSAKKKPIPIKWRHLLFWGGLRGALVMALALSLPLSLPERESLINLTFGVVLFTLLVSGLTMEPLVKFLSLTPKRQTLREYRQWKALLFACKAELHQLKEMYVAGHISLRVYELLDLDLHRRIDEIQKQLKQLELSDIAGDEQRLRKLRLRLIEFTKDYLSKLAKQGLLTDQSLYRLQLEMETELDVLQENVSDAETKLQPRNKKPKELEQ